ncbi:MAG: hypothetical protein AAFO07_09815 [Bacteroidota bacterium]
MPIKYTPRGYLDPPNRQDLSIVEFEQYFVESFPKSQTRKELFEGFIRYNNAFQQEVTNEMIQWIGGSFTTKKLNPRDIDLVTIMPYSIFEEKSELIEKRFRRSAKNEYGIDAYIVSAYPEEHDKHGLYRGIMVYWNNQFSKTRKNRAGKRFKRGYVQIIHQKLEL